ncbi:clock-controlled protein 8 [Neurospora hispaniola]|uniref:Clock-controlled protein 8 n=1 Tax=Neurospora hispaniola TaxID=588809 RepID=A0AAJ0MUR6_9PEZI|nr:clock-controlled protein 8 [Neurospora hispaniola]
MEHHHHHRHMHSPSSQQHEHQQHQQYQQPPQHHQHYEAHQHQQQHQHHQQQQQQHPVPVPKQEQADNTSAPVLSALPAYPTLPPIWDSTHSPALSASSSSTMQASASSLSSLPPLVLHPPSNGLQPNKPRSRSPSSNRFQTREPAPLSLFDGSPTTELPPIQLDRKRSSSDHSLPSIASLNVGSSLQPTPTPQPPPKFVWPNSNPLSAYYAESDNDGRGASPQQRHDRRSTSVSLDDPQVMMAISALNELKTDSVSSPPNRNAPLRRGMTDQNQEPEPLLSLITTAHPIIESTVQRSSHLYTKTKNFSPRIRSGLEYVEGSLIPVADTVNNVGRRTGIESGVRWILGKRTKSSSDTRESGQNKRHMTSRPTNGTGGEARFSEAPTADASRRTSVSTIETLPAYDDQRSPAYSETVEQNGQAVDPKSALHAQLGNGRVQVTTSSLKETMKEESLRSLKYVLETLRDVTNTLQQGTNELSSVLDQYDRSTTRRDGEDHVMTNGSAPEEDRTRLVERMTELRKSIYSNIKDVSSVVANYTGAALPENAGNLVRHHLLSLPMVWSQASKTTTSSEQPNTQDPNALVRKAAKVALSFSKEGLHIFSQIMEIIRTATDHAEDWRNKKMNQMTPTNGAEQEIRPLIDQPLPQVATINGDIPMR